MIASDLYQKAPGSPRGMALLLITVAIIAAGVLLSPLFFIAFAVPVAYVIFSWKFPGSFFAFAADSRRQLRVFQFNEFLDILQRNRVFTRSTPASAVSLSLVSSDPLVFDLSVRAAGVQDRQVEKAALDGLPLFDKASVVVDKTGNFSWRIRYADESALDALARSEVGFDDFPGITPSLDCLPVGAYSDGSPVCLSLSSRNMLLAGSPRAGKSVLLQCLIHRLVNLGDRERVIVFSPKSLDFAFFGDAIQLENDIEAMCRCLVDIYKEVNRRKALCERAGLTKLSPEQFSAKVPHITLVIDEFTVLKTSEKTDDKGKKIKIGEKFEMAVMRLVAEAGFAGLSVVISTQKADSRNVDTRLRDLISGCRCSMAVETIESTRMLFGEYADSAPAHEITRSQVGCGYISLDGGVPLPFKGAYMPESDLRSIYGGISPVVSIDDLFDSIDLEEVSYE